MNKSVLCALLIVGVILFLMCSCGAIQWHPENLTFDKLTTGRSSLVHCAKNPDLPECQ